MRKRAHARGTHHYSAFVVNALNSTQSQWKCKSPTRHSSLLPPEGVARTKKYNLMHVGTVLMEASMLCQICRL
eukprot:1159476-Pelagomonas_calceolata.AAC.5